MRVFHVDSPSCVERGVPHMWLAAKASPLPFLSMECLERSGCDRKDPIS